MFHDEFKNKTTEQKTTNKSDPISTVVNQFKYDSWKLKLNDRLHIHVKNAFKLQYYKYFDSEDKIVFTKMDEEVFKIAEVENTLQKLNEPEWATVAETLKD